MNGAAVLLDLRDIRERSGGQARGDAARNLVAGRGSRHDDGGRVGLPQCGQRVDLREDEAGIVVRRLRVDDLGRAQLAELFGEGIGVAAHDNCGNRPERTGGGDQLRRHGIQLVSVVLDQNIHVRHGE